MRLQGCVLYLSEWIGDAAFLPPAARGDHFLLAFRSFTEGAIPEPENFTEHWKTIRHLWEHTETGWVCTRMERAREQSTKWYNQRVEAGKRSGEARRTKRVKRGNKTNDRSTTVQRPMNDRPTTDEQTKQNKTITEQNETENEGFQPLSVSPAKPDHVREVVEFLNLKTGKHYRAETPATRKTIQARLNEGFSVEDCKAVISIKAAQWGRDGDMKAFLRVSTLFCPKHFEDYLNEAHPGGNGRIPTESKPRHRAEEPPKSGADYQAELAKRLTAKAGLVDGL